MTLHNVSDVTTSSLDDWTAPSHTPSDYIEIVLDALLIAVGVPVNVFAFCRGLEAYRARQANRLVRALTFIDIHYSTSVRCANGVRNTYAALVRR